MEHYCRLHLVSSKGLVFLQPRLICKALPAESKYIMILTHREREKAHTIGFDVASTGMGSDESEHFDE